MTQPNDSLSDSIKEIWGPRLDDQIKSSAQMLEWFWRRKKQTLWQHRWRSLLNFLFPGAYAFTKKRLTYLEKVQQDIAALSGVPDISKGMYIPADDPDRGQKKAYVFALNYGTSQPFLGIPVYGPGAEDFLKGAGS